METVRPDPIGNQQRQTAGSREREPGGLVFFKVDKKLSGNLYAVRTGNALREAFSDVPLERGSTYRGTFVNIGGKSWIRLPDPARLAAISPKTLGLPEDRFSFLSIEAATNAGIPLDRAILKKARSIAMKSQHPEEAAFVFFHALRNGVELGELAVIDVCRYADAESSPGHGHGGKGCGGGWSGDKSQDEGETDSGREGDIGGFLAALPGLSGEPEGNYYAENPLLSIINGGAVPGYPSRKLVPFRMKIDQVDLRGFLSVYYDVQERVSRTDAQISCLKEGHETSWWCSVEGRNVRFRVPDGASSVDELERALALVGMSLECVTAGVIPQRVDIDA